MVNFAKGPRELFFEKMSPVLPASASSSTAVPSEVASFAAMQGVSDYLLPVLEMTQRLFPNQRLNVFLEDDPEIVNDGHIVLEVDAGDMEVAVMVAHQNRWTTGLFQHCPATLVCVFRLAMV